jgi:hypothetical protein
MNELIAKLDNRRKCREGDSVGRQPGNAPELDSLEEVARSKAASQMECAPDGGQIAGWELTGVAGLSEDESHGQAPHP